MGLYLKYPSLTNHYSVQNSRLLSSYLFGENKDVEFYATEKIDGSNIQLSFNTDTKEYEFFKRSGEIEEDEKPFNSIKEIITDEEVSNIIDTFVGTYPEYSGKNVHIYGELFGSKIQKQDYDLSKDNKRSIRFYDIIVGGYGANDMVELGMLPLQVVVPNKFLPYFVESGEKKHLEDWLKDEPSSSSHYGGVNEGYVFKMVDTHSFDADTSYIGIKYKTDAYLEVAKVPKTPKKPIMVANPELVADISRYATEQRVMNIVSHGDVTLEFENFGKLMSLMSADIIKEYTRDEDHEGYTEEDIEAAVNKGINKITATVVRRAIQSNQKID